MQVRFTPVSFHTLSPSFILYPAQSFKRKEGIGEPLNPDLNISMHFTRSKSSCHLLNWRNGIKIIYLVLVYFSIICRLLRKILASAYMIIAPNLNFKECYSIALVFLLRINITCDKKMTWKYSHRFWHSPEAIKECQNPNYSLNNLFFCSKELLLGGTPFQYTICHLIT